MREILFRGKTKDGKMVDEFINKYSERLVCFAFLWFIIWLPTVFFKPMLFFVAILPISIGAVIGLSYGLFEMAYFVFTGKEL